MTDQHGIRPSSSLEDRAPIFTRPFVTIWAANFILFISFQMLLPTLPAHVFSICSSDFLVGLVNGAISFSSIAVRPFSGKLYDTKDRKALLIGGLMMFALFTLSYGIVVSVFFLILLRFLQGVSWAFSSTGSNTLASDIIPTSRFGEGIGYFTLSTSLALAIGPALGLTIYHHVGFQAVTFVSAGTLCFAIVLVLLVPKTYRYALRRDADSRVQGSRESASVSAEKTSLIERTAIRPAVSMGLVTASLSAMNGFISIYAHSFGVDNVALYFVVYAIAMIASRPLAGKVVDRFGTMLSTVPGLGFVIAGLIVLAFTYDMTGLVLTAILYGIGFGAVQTSLQSLAVMHVAPHRRGAATSTFFIGFDLGIGVGAIAGGSLAQVAGYSTMYLVLAGCAVVSLAYFIASAKLQRVA